MTEPKRDNVLIVHWHDLGRYLGVYGHADVSSPRLDQLAAEGILFTRAHATAPLCSPSRGSLFTGRYPQSNGLVGLAHHGWEYRAGVRTLPAASCPNPVGIPRFSECSTRRRTRRGWVSTSSTCRTRTASTSSSRPTSWLRQTAPTAAVPADRRVLRDPPAVSARPVRARRRRGVDAARLPARHPGGARRTSPTSTARSRWPTPPSGELLDTLAETGLDRHHLGGVPDRPRPGASPRQVHAVRRGHRHRDDRPAADAAGRSRRGSTTSCSAASTWCPRCWSSGRRQCPPTSTAFRTPRHLLRRLARHARARPRCTRRRPTTTRSTRSAQSAPRNTATSRTTRRGRCSTCRGTSRKARPGRRSRHWSTRHVPERELYDLRRRPHRSAQPARPVTHRQGRGDRQRSRAAAQRLAAEDQRRHSVGVRRHPHLRALHRNLSAHPRHGRYQPVGDRRRTRHRRRATSQ